MIELQQVTVRYSNRGTALFPTDLSFGRGLVHVVLGPSGAGKSTLLRCLNGLVTPTGGQVRSGRLGVISGAKLWREHRRRAGFVFQQHHLLPRRSVLQNVLCARLGYHPFWRGFFPAPEADRRLALDSLVSVGLIDKALERADQLSVGQQQRVGLARALCQEPELILADEPVASLDPASARQAMTLIAGVCRERAITAVISLHQVDLAREFGDRIVGLSRGGVVFDGTPDQLTQQSLSRIYGTELPTMISEASYELR